MIGDGKNAIEDQLGVLPRARPHSPRILGEGRGRAMMNRTPLPPTLGTTPSQPAPQFPQRWPPGVSGNPAGRPKGTRHRALNALDLVGQDAAADIMRSVVAAAKAGDMRAADILLARLWPVRRGRPVRLDLPSIVSAADLARALGAVVAAVAAGELTPEEAASVGTVLEAQRRAIELRELKRRIAALEAPRDE